MEVPDDILESVYEFIRRFNFALKHMPDLPVGDLMLYSPLNLESVVKEKAIHYNLDKFVEIMENGKTKNN